MHKKKPAAAPQTTMPKDLIFTITKDIKPARMMHIISKK